MYPDSVRPPVLSICVPTFNRARYLDCLLQDLAGTIGELGVPYELLIGDNASEDSTAEVVRKYESRLAIRYFRRQENVGWYHNFGQLYESARGRYVIYLADDDLLIPAALGRHIAYLEDHPELGAVFAPWLNHDRVVERDTGLFYTLDRETLIESGDYRALFSFLVGFHIFPEIYVARTSLLREVMVGACPYAYSFFVQIALMVDRTSVAFRPEPFYRQVGRYFADESRAQAGHEETKMGWDRYRGGVEYILSRFASRLSEDELRRCFLAIDEFTVIRMQVGLRVRTWEGKDWIDNYYIANRLRCVGNDSYLSAPYETYRVNAALEYLLTVQPFYPRSATVAYYRDDPPQILAQASGFTAAKLLSLEDRSAPLPDDVILLVNREPAPANIAAFVISEQDVLARFP